MNTLVDLKNLEDFRRVDFAGLPEKVRAKYTI